MARVQILYWREIPAVVEASDGTDHVKQQLSERFQTLIDAVAMRLGMTGTDDYLEQWALGDPTERPGTAREALDAVVAEMERRFEEFRDRDPGPGGR